MKKLILYIFIQLPFLLLAQTNGDEYNHIDIEEGDNSNATYVARQSITIHPGFETIPGDEFMACIDPDLPLNNGTPVSDGVFNLNYVRVYNPLHDWRSSISPIHGSDIYNNWAENITYIDGLGRPMQKVGVMASSTEADIIQPIVYDDFGREKQSYLSYTIVQEHSQHGPGGYRPDALSENQQFYSNYFGDDDGAFAYSDKVFENSPLNRVEKQSSPGYDWRLNNGGNIQYDYELNSSGEIPNLIVLDNGNLDHDGDYGPNTLYKNTVTDEDGKITIEYKNSLGQVICTKQGDLATYNVYDDFGLLRYVIPPKAYNLIASNESFIGNIYTNDIIKDLCYYYQYDGRKRMTHKKLPGADVIYMVYNKRDQLILSQDGNLRNPDETQDSYWLFTKYDILDRPIITGKYTASSEMSQQNMQLTVNSPSFELYEEFDEQSGYSSNAFPRVNFEIFTESYYDNYDALNFLYPSQDYKFEFISNFFLHLENNTESTNIKGLPTVSMTKVLLDNDESTEKDQLISVTYYDKYHHAVQLISDNHLGGLERISSKVNFTGEVLKVKQEHILYDETTTIDQQFVYNKSGQVLKEYHQINGSYPVTTQNKYTELSQLSFKRLHAATDGSNPVQQIDYKYNIRGWLTKMNHPESLGNDLFAMQLDFNNDSPGSLLNGNISSMQWVSQQFNDIKQYNFSYDAYNRLSAAVFVNNDTYSTQYDYDANGNMGIIKRKGLYNSGVDFIDNLTLTYGNTNQLKTVTDNAPIGFKDLGFNENDVHLEQEYYYDANGNMYRDKNKGIELITYNHLNLPTYIGIDQDQSKKINYIYTATGGKLRKYTSNNGAEQTQTDYVGSFIYENNQLSFIQTSEGRLVPKESGGFAYEYAIKDHLGNTRIMFNENGKILQDESYYPFGLSFGAELTYVNTLNSPKNKYLYNGKEKQMDFDLGWYDYGSRFYDPELGRWSVIDPLLEKYTNNSPYNYVLNRPMIAFDPDGMRYASYESDESGRGNYGVIETLPPLIGVKERFEGPGESKYGGYTIDFSSNQNSSKSQEAGVIGDGLVTSILALTTVAKARALNNRKANEKSALQFASDVLDMPEQPDPSGNDVMSMKVGYSKDGIADASYGFVLNNGKGLGITGTVQFGNNAVGSIGASSRFYPDDNSFEFYNRTKGPANEINWNGEIHFGPLMINPYEVYKLYDGVQNFFQDLINTKYEKITNPEKTILNRYYPNENK